jgi:ketosteroid isomerase-like protein
MPTGSLIERYFRAFAAGDAEAASAFFAPAGLYEFPLLRPRLVGRAEILAGHRQALSVASRLSVSLRAVQSQGATTIVEGRLTAHVARDGRNVDVPFAAVAEETGGLLQRLSIYCDAHPYRLWCDGPVMAIGEGAR